MIRIGTSGWVYDHWKGVFYPEGLAQEEQLPFFAQTFDTVEINYSFYRLPDEETVKSWAGKVPKGFLFSPKASRYITHMKKLLDPEVPVAGFLDRMALLGAKLGPVLFQLPPAWHVNADRLAHFVHILPKRHRYVFEFRHASWYTDAVYDILEEGGCGFCIHDNQDAASPEKLTAEFTYVRFHGKRGGNDGKYTRRDLEACASKIARWAEDGIDVYCYFNNDWKGYAVENARELQELAGKEAQVRRI